ncbi:MFS general substrate transporter [Piedraia hortae CBS 480.64]|uniref:MFS general substrate transporter n=1 Tax=Piedraia hortae CBS 480.64 TaxID=1314780 RepID=A0A6A7BSS0_9PEZI|nr:MFS general substrate transporter [Piedraia hortae CBS 480.64]
MEKQVEPLQMEKQSGESPPPQGFDIIPAHEEAQLLRRLDMFIVPIIMLLYLSCFLDRANIGNVKVAGMPKDIHATVEQFSIAVSIFYATYVLSETPWAIMLKKLTPRYLLTGLAIVWSLVTIFSGFITSIGGLYATRLILGACEGGLFPGLNLYLTMVYRREEQAKRVSYLFVCTAIAGAFGGLLAYGLLQMDGISGVAGWRWVYYIEGCFSVVIAAVVFFGLPNDPANAYFLSEPQKELMRRRAIQRAGYMGSDDISFEEIKVALTDPKIYLSGLISFCQDTLLYGFSTFLPSIIKGWGYGTLKTQYYTIPVYVVGGLSFVIMANISDRLRLRGPFLLIANCFGIIGYVLLLSPLPVGVHYLATFFCAIAVYTGPGINVTWLNVNIAPHYRRATAIGMQQTIGNTAGIVAGQIYRKAPYKLGNGFSLGAICIGQFLITAQMLHYRYLTREKAAISEGRAEDKRKVRTGDRALDFDYHL